VVRDHLQAGLLVRLPIRIGESLPGFGILTRRGEPLSATATEFVQSLRRYGAMMEQGSKQHGAGQPLRMRKGRKVRASSTHQ
jgi:hypothetical protein